MLHPEFDRLLNLAKGHGCYNTVITNGSILDGCLDIYLPLLDQVIISLDAHSSEVYEAIRGIDCFYRIVTLPNKIKMKNPAIEVAVCFLIQRRNIDYLAHFLEMVAVMPVDRVALLVPDFSGFANPDERGHSFGRIRAATPESLAEVVPTLTQVQDLRNKQSELNRHFGGRVNCPTLQNLDQYCSYFEDTIRGFSPAEGGFCLFPFRKIVVTATGRLKPCFFVAEEVEVTTDIDPLQSPQLTSIRYRLHNDAATRDRSCRHCLQTKRGH